MESIGKPYRMQSTLNVETINLARQGDAVVIGMLYEKYHTSVYRYLYYRVGDVHTAEDLTSEVFLRMIRYLPDYRPEGSSFQTWLFQIAHNLTVDHFRKASNRNHVPLDENIIAPELDMDASIDRRLTSARLLWGLSRLNEYQRDVIVLRFVIGLPVSEVALTLNKTEDTIKGLQRRGLAALRKMLTE